MGEKSCELVTVSDAGALSIDTISTSVVPWFEVDIEASSCQTADEVYDKLRTALLGMLSQSRERITAIPSQGSRAHNNPIDEHKGSLDLRKSR